MIIRRIFLIILVVFAVAIRVFSSSGAVVEKYYSTGVYPYISAAQRILLGWVPFSVGDLFYAFAGIYLVYSLVKLIKRIARRKAESVYFKNVGLNLITGALAVYVAFNLLWGLNYNRQGIDFQLGLNSLEYTNDDLITVAGLVASKMNELQPASEKTRPLLRKKSHLFKSATEAYKQQSRETVIEYRYPSVKPSIFSYLGNYLGFTGYYNPFSGEAQVNTTIPLFIRPFTTCHEIGHQLGYAKESEANFAGYLSATSSNDSSFLYSVYFEMFAYSARYLYYADSNALRQITDQLSPAVKKDIRELREFYEGYENPLETAIDRLYSQYLKANEQPSGKMSYSEVVAMLIAYYKKNGRV
ncbi:MAG: DUF3810 domain-containing protein [Chitinophagaceae bacterium]|nr:DUF3810 domain-containing protein [Chitinophagaceae bacterium]